MRAVIERLTSPTLLQSVDGTRKFLFSLKDGLAIESVLIPDGERLTLCVSTQVGCTLDCGFCVTGHMGLKRNLKAHEIVDQVLTAQDRLEAGHRISSLVFMGMGEPLANFDELSEALTRLTDTDWGVGFPKRRITISTAGFSQRLHDVAEAWGEPGGVAERLDCRAAGPAHADDESLTPPARSPRGVPRVSRAGEPSPDVRVRVVERGKRFP